MDFFRKTLIEIDYLVTPLFIQPESIDNIKQDKRAPFHIEIQSAEFPNFEADRFCQALSLSCNSAVLPMFDWNYINEDEIFSIRGEGSVGGPNRIPPFDSKGAAYVSQAQIEEAKRLYEKLVKQDSNFREKLQIPINRWIKSKTREERIDKIIDLGIAFEALYLSDVNEELTFRLGVRAAWYLGKDEEHRKELLKKFGDIYRCRSNAVHNGKLGKTARFGEKDIPISEFIEGTQDLCRESIMKILDDGKFPDWNSLILGGAAESDVGDSAGLG